MNRFVSTLKSAWQRHSRYGRLSVALGALLVGSGVTAFSLASLSPDVANLPVQQLIEAVTPIANTAPSEREPVVPMVFYRSEITRSSDSVNTLLRRLGVSDGAAADFLIRDTASRTLLSGATSKLVSVETNDRQKLQRLTARWLSDDKTQFSRLIVELGSRGYTSRVEVGQLNRSVRFTSATVRSSLAVATKEARLPDTVATQLTDAFSSVIDFRDGLRVGDSFRVVYETLEVDGEVLRIGKLLGAEFSNKGQKHQVVWFQEPGQKGGFFTMDGQSVRRQFMSSPLASSRLSSGYGMRVHPILGAPKAHQGTDFASPSGTPIRSVADGAVVFAGWKNGYGKFIIVKHRDQKSTAYAHLSRIQVRKGQAVQQGDLIGAVGRTGAATGPNLHFEYIVKGRQQDPLEIARQRDGQPISTATRGEFKRITQTMREQLNAAALMAQASAE